MVDADPGLESGAKPVYYPVWRPDAAAVKKFRLHKIRDTLKSPFLGNTGDANPAAVNAESRFDKVEWSNND